MYNSKMKSAQIMKENYIDNISLNIQKELVGNISTNNNPTDSNNNKGTVRGSPQIVVSKENSDFPRKQRQQQQQQQPLIQNHCQHQQQQRQQQYHQRRRQEQLQQQQQQQQHLLLQHQMSRHKQDGSTIALDVPLLTIDNLIIRCKHEKGRYLPIQILSYQQIVNYLRNISYKEYSIVTQIFSSNPLNKENMTREDTVDPEYIPHPHPSIRKQRNASTSTPSNTNQSSKLKRARSVLLEMSQATDNGRFPQTYTEISDKEKQYEKQYETQMKWVAMQDKHDYVAMEQLKTTEEFEVLLKVLMNCKSPTLMQIKLNKDDSFTVVYQFIENFRQEYMLLMIGTKYCLFLEPF